MRFPISPYTIYVNTLSGTCIMDFQETEWHLPIEVKLSGVDAAIQDLRNHIDKYPIGMWGYPIERLEYCSPMDIHANLTANQACYLDSLIVGFQVIGYVPDSLPPEIHPDNHDPDDDEEDVDTILESAAIDKEAHKAATSPKNNLSDPTEAQKEAGNYKKGHVTIQGLDIAIENPAGSERSGIGLDGKRWTVTMPAHYGYVKKTKAPDGDNFDVYIGKNPDSDQVFVVDQLDAKTGKFDKCKGIIGCNDAEEARELYCKGFSNGKGSERIGALTELSMETFKKWLSEGDTMKSVSNAILESSPDPLVTEYKGWVITVAQYDRGWSGNAQKGDERLSFRGWERTQKEAVSTLQAMVDAHDAYLEKDPSWIGVDLDGTLARYDGWVDEDHIGEPVPLMMDFVKHLTGEGKTVKIFTARASDPATIPPVKEWLEKYGLGYLEITNMKDQNMTMLYDDRVAKVIPNMGVILESDGEFDWREAIRVAKSIADIQSVFEKLFPIAIKKITGASKERWEMTISEFWKQNNAILSEDQTYAIHLQDVQDAIKAGKNVPAEVMAEFPEILTEIKNKLIAYIRNYPDFIFESKYLANKSREEIRQFLEGISPADVKALKFGLHEEYIEFLKELVEKLFPVGANYTFRKKEDGTDDHEHFLKDARRKDYIHTFGDTIENKDIHIEFTDADKDKEYFIKKYFDTEIQRDIWDIIVVHDKEIRSKFARRGRKGAGYIEGLISGAGNEASHSATPGGNEENASTRTENTKNNISSSIQNVKQEKIISGEIDPSKFEFPAESTPNELQAIWNDLYGNVEDVEKKNQPVIEELRKELNAIGNKLDKAIQSRKKELRERISQLHNEAVEAYNLVECAFQSAQEKMIHSIIEKARSEGLMQDEDDEERVYEIFNYLQNGHAHDYAFIDGSKGPIDHKDTWNMSLAVQVLEELRADAGDTKYLKGKEKENDS